MSRNHNRAGLTLAILVLIRSAGPVQGDELRLRSRERFRASLQSTTTSLPSRAPRLEVLSGRAFDFSPAAPFPQNLAEAKNDPADPAGDLGVYAYYVLRQFEAKNAGRAPTTDLELAVAVTDWVSTTLRHPAFYPEDPSLPRFYAHLEQDPAYASFYWEPVRILNYTMRFSPDDAANWPSPQCTAQNFAAAGLLNYFGLHARLVDVEGHSGLEYFSFEYGKWIWCDATFNEHYLGPDDDIPLGVRDLNDLTLSGRESEVRVVKHGYPTSLYPDNTYIRLLPHGFREYAVTTYMRVFGGKGAALMQTATFVCAPEPPPEYVPLPGEVMHLEDSPDNGGWYCWSKTANPDDLDARLDQLEMWGPPSWNLSTGQFTFRLRSSLPFTERFEMWTETSPSWETIGSVETVVPDPVVSPDLTLGIGLGVRTVRLRAVDNVGNRTKEVSFVLE